MCMVGWMKPCLASKDPRAGGWPYARPLKPELVRAWRRGAGVREAEIAALSKNPDHFKQTQGLHAISAYLFVAVRLSHHQHASEVTLAN